MTVALSRVPGASPDRPPMPTLLARTVRATACVLMAAGLVVDASAARAADAPLPLKPWPANTATPALRLDALDGKPLDLANLRGKVVVVNFWAGWCEPCVNELPVLGALARRFDGRVAVVGVNYKESLDTIGRFTAAHPIPYPVLRDRDGAAFKLWTAGVMPTTILVDRRGRARWRTAGEIGADDTGLQRAIDALLAE